MGSVNVLERLILLEKRDSIAKIMIAGSLLAKQRILKLTGKKNTLYYIRSLKTSTELPDNIEKAMQETRKAKLRKVDL